MKHNCTLRIAAGWLIAVFLFFYIGNTTFIHVHSFAGGNIVHSHPYFPGKCHSHTAQEMANIAQANMFAGTMDATESIEVAEPAETYTDNFVGYVVGGSSRMILEVDGRSPPSWFESHI